MKWTALLVSAGWLLGVLLFGVLLLVGLWRTVKLRRTSLTVFDGDWPGMLVELRQRLGLSRSVELREHAESVVPLTWGIWRPVVLLPKLARAWDEPMRRAVLLHELAHVQRGDVACQVLGRLTCVLYWFHPLAWFALRQLRQEREQACDDAVVQTGEKASDYAEQLLAVARMCCAPRGLSLGVAMAEGSSLERRVKSLFDSARSHGPLTRRVAIASFLIGGAILAGLAPIEPTASKAEPPVVNAVKKNAVEKENVIADPPSETEERILEGDAARQQMDLLKPVFGEAKRGIQLGLAVGSQQRTFTANDRIPLWLFYRNVGDQELTFNLSQDFMNSPPTVTDASGKRVQVNFVMHWMFIPPLTITLKPGEVWCIATPGLYLSDRMPSIKPVAGKYKLTYPQGIWSTELEERLEIEGALAGQVVNSPTWSEQLDTGTIEFAIGARAYGTLEARITAANSPPGSKLSNAKTEQEMTPKEKKIHEALRSTTRLELSDASLQEVLQEIGKTHNIAVVIDNVGLRDVGQDINERQSFHVSGIRLSSLLQLILEPRQLGYVVENDVLQITSQQRLLKTTQGLLQYGQRNRQRLQYSLHIQMRHAQEYTDAFRAHYRIAAEREEMVLKAIQQMTTEEFATANSQLPQNVSPEYLRLSVKHNLESNRAMANMHNATISDVELFQKDAAYQIRTPFHSRDRVSEPLSFPSEPLTADNLGTTYKRIGFYSWAPQTMPSGTIVYGSQPQCRQITSKPYHTNGGRPIPAFSIFVRTGSHDWHPIDAFFAQSPDTYREIGRETIDGRELVIVEVPVPTPFTSGFSKPDGGNEQLKIVHYYRAWLDPSRGSLPVKILIWHGNEKTDFSTLVSHHPRSIMTTQQIQEVTPGGWYPTLTTLDKYDRDAEKMPKAPLRGEGAEWDKYLKDSAKVPLVVHERETWKCDLVEIPQTLTDDFFVLPTPAGAQIIDRDQQDLKDELSGGLPVDELAEMGTFLGKAWLLRPHSVIPVLSNDGGIEEVPQKEPMSVGQNKETPKEAADVDLDQVVWWGEAVDGLEPGFWLTKSEDPRNQRIPMDSLVKYCVVVRNTTDKEIEFLVRLLPFDDQDVPYLIPSDKLDSKGRITPPQPAKEFQAQGAAKELYGLNAIQAITLDAGESVLLPECGLYVGKAPDERYPQIADFVPGTHWIAQPLLVHPLTFKERGEFIRLHGKDPVTKISRDGKTRQEGVVIVTGSWDQELKLAYAKYHFEVGTLNAEASRNAVKALWGEVEQGMQCGIRLLNPKPSYKIGDTLEAEVLWRNTTAAVISTTRPRQLDLYPIIQDAKGNEKLIDFGARFDLLPGNYDYQPGEVISLGISQITLVAEGTPSPKTNMEPGQITLEPGKYQLIGNGGVGNINPRSGKIEFEVASQLVKTQPSAPSELPRLRLTGAEVTQERIRQLEGKSWSHVALIDGQFNGAIIEALRHAQSIQSLHLSGTGLSGQIPRLEHVQGLTDLTLSEMQLTARDFEAIGELTQLTGLQLPQESTLNVIGAAEIAKLTQLKVLGLYLVNMDDTAFHELGTLTQLESLDLTHTRITDQGLAVLTRMPRLKTLELDRFPDNHIKQQISDAGLASVTQLKELQRLSLSGQVSDAGLQAVARLPKLTSLSIHNTQITPVGLNALIDSKVETLFLTVNQLGPETPGSDVGFNSLRQSKTLKTIHVYGKSPINLDTLQRLVPHVDWGFSS